MAKSPSRPPDDDPPIADAASLFHDERGGASAPKSPGPKAPASDDVFEVLGDEPEDGSGEVVPPVPVTPAASRAKKRPAPPEVEDDRPTKRSPGESATVEQVWSRGTEWGPTLVLLLFAGLAYLALIYFTASADNIGFTLLIITLGGAFLILLSYPIVITLERPVRITPEQAVKDYYAALSHHFPHYRRMWLLLSSAGHVCAAYGSFEGFRSYWKKRLDQLRAAGRAKGSTPLSFQIDEFKADKSAGKQYVDAKFAVLVYVRGRHGEGPIEKLRVETGLVKGPDNMWYLNQGTLPTKSSSSPAEPRDRDA